jgi:hypothetical protein
MLETIDTYERNPSVLSSFRTKPVNRHNGNSRDRRFQRQFYEEEKENQKNRDDESFTPLERVDIGKSTVDPTDSKFQDEHTGKKGFDDNQEQRVDVFA